MENKNIRGKNIEYIKNRNIKLDVFVQARMSSTRLPDKIMIDICGKPLLLRVVERIRRSAYNPRIIIATTLNVKDKAVRDFAASMGVDVFCGSEDDVLERFYTTAQEYGSDVIVRVCSDNALFDSSVMDKILDEFFRQDGLDYASNSLENTLPVGVNCEVFTRGALEKAYREADTQACREHVTPYIFLNPDKFNIFTYSICEDLSKYRWTVDAKQDLELVTCIYEYFYKKRGRESYFGMDEIIEAYKENPGWLHINESVTQKLIGYKGK